MYTVLYIDKKSGQIKVSGEFNLMNAHHYAYELEQAGHIQVKIYSKLTNTIIGSK